MTECDHFLAPIWQQRTVRSSSVAVRRNLCRPHIHGTVREGSGPHGGAGCSEGGCTGPTWVLGSPGGKALGMRRSPCSPCCGAWRVEFPSWSHHSGRVWSRRASGWWAWMGAHSASWCSCSQPCVWCLRGGCANQGGGKCRGQRTSPGARSSTSSNPLLQHLLSCSGRFSIHDSLLARALEALLE